jgi:uncharacterized small protein (DUF1192 family)
MPTVIQNIANKSISVVRSPDGIPAEAFKEAIRTQEQSTVRMMEELRAAALEVSETAEMTLKTVSNTNDEIARLQNEIARIEAVIDLKPTLTRISSHRDCQNILTVRKGHCELMTAPEYRLDRLKDVLFEKPVFDAVIPEKPKIWNGWFSDPTFRDFSNITIKFEEGICVVITRYFLGSVIPDLTQSPYLLSWKLEGRVCGKWRILNSQNVINIISDSKCHDFYIQTEHCAVEVSGLCQTGRKCFGSCQMYLTTSCLSGHVMSRPEMF